MNKKLTRSALIAGAIAAAGTIVASALSIRRKEKVELIVPEKDLTDTADKKFEVADSNPEEKVENEPNTPEEEIGEPTEDWPVAETLVSPEEEQPIMEPETQPEEKQVEPSEESQPVAVAVSPIEDIDPQQAKASIADIDDIVASIMSDVEKDDSDNKPAEAPDSEPLMATTSETVLPDNLVATIDKQLDATLQSVGEAPEVSLQHYVAFDDELAATAYGRYLAETGMTVNDGKTPENLLVIQTMACDKEEMKKSIIDFVAGVLKRGGHYRGWSIVKD